MSEAVEMLRAMAQAARDYGNTETADEVEEIATEFERLSKCRIGLLLSPNPQESGEEE